MEHFAGYGFNKSHSTAYAFLAYQTAYLKANYPWHFAAALLTIEAQNTDKLALYLGECRERGIPLLPPDINESELRFTVEPGKGVRFGLTAIKNVGEGAIESLLEVRKKQGRITSLHALCEDLDLRLVNKRVFESLVKAGAFDSLARGDPALTGLPSAALRPRLFAAIDAACEHGARIQRDRDEGQAQLFGAFDAAADASTDGGRAGVGCRFRRPRRGPTPSSSPTRRRRWGCTGAGIRWTATRPSSRASAPGRPASSPTRRSTARGPTRGGRAGRSRSSPTPASAASSPPAAS